MVVFVGPEIEPKLDWIALTKAIEAGHRLPKAAITDSFLYQGNATLLNRAAWIESVGIAVKSATVFPDNPAQGRPMIGGAVNLFDTVGTLAAVIDFHLVTKWKTAADSLLGAMPLARPDSTRTGDACRADIVSFAQRREWAFTASVAPEADTIERAVCGDPLSSGVRAMDAFRAVTDQD